MFKISFHKIRNFSTEKIGYLAWWSRCLCLPLFSSRGYVGVLSKHVDFSDGNDECQTNGAHRQHVHIDCVRPQRTYPTSTTGNHDRQVDLRGSQRTRDVRSTDTPHAACRSTRSVCWLPSRTATDAAAAAAAAGDRDSNRPSLKASACRQLKGFGGSDTEMHWRMAQTSHSIVRWTTDDLYSSRSLHWVVINVVIVIIVIIHVTFLSH